jgi:hypothetical protein
VVERVAAFPERLAVFYTVQLGEAELTGAGAVGLRLLVRDGIQHPVQPPPWSSFPPKRHLRAAVAHFVGQPPGAEVEFEVFRVLERRRHDCDVRLPVPTELPAVVSPDAPWPTGHRLVEAVFTERGVVLRFSGPQGRGAGLLMASLACDDGRGVPVRGGVGARRSRWSSSAACRKEPEGSSTRRWRPMCTVTDRGGSAVRCPRRCPRDDCRQGSRPPPAVLRFDDKRRGQPGGYRVARKASARLLSSEEGLAACRRLP